MVLELCHGVSPSEEVENKNSTPSTMASTSDEESPSPCQQNQGETNDPLKRSRQRGFFTFSSPLLSKKKRSGPSPNKNKFVPSFASPWRGTKPRDDVGTPEKDQHTQNTLQKSPMMLESEPKLTNTAKRLWSIDTTIELTPLKARSKEVLPSKTDDVVELSGQSSTDSCDSLLSTSNVVKQSPFKRGKEALRNTFAPTGQGKRLVVLWKDCKSQLPSNKGESTTTRGRKNKKFRETVATLVDLDLALLQNRLDDWCISDRQVKEVVENVAANRNRSEAEVVATNIKAFVQDLSKGFSGKGGGTRTNQEQRALEIVLVAANWLKQPPARRIESFFGISFRLASKVKDMAKSQTYASERSRRLDSLLPKIWRHVHAFCHDDSVTRVETGGRTANNFVTVYDTNGEKQQHMRRIWPWSTMLERYKMFLTSQNYDAYVEELMHEEYFAKRFSQEVASKEKKLRRVLDRVLDRKLSIADLTEALRARGIKTKEDSTWNILVSVLYNYEFGDLELQEEEEAGGEEGITKYVFLRSFENCLCPCVRDPRMESCVDTMLNQVQVFAKSMGDVLTYNRAIKQEIQDCPCKNCADDHENQPTLNGLLKSYPNVYGLIESTCCNPDPFPDFMTELDRTTPRLIPRQCTDPTMTCERCGVDRLLYAAASNCPVWKGCRELVKTLEYKPQPRSGENSNGEQRSQIELTPVTLEFNELYVKYCDILRDARRHLNNTSWANRKIINTDNSVSEVRLSAHIDYAATMDLHPIYKANCHENAHVANLVIILHWRPKWVAVPMIGSHSSKQHFLRENWAVHSFFDTISRGKKTDALGIRYSLIEDFVIIFKEVLARNPGWTLGTHSFLDLFTISSDNCKNQNKCSKHFLNMVNLCRDLSPRLAVMWLQHRKKRNEEEAGLEQSVEQMESFGIEEVSCGEDSLLHDVNEEGTSQTNCTETLPWPLEDDETDRLISEFKVLHWQLAALGPGETLPTDDDELGNAAGTWETLLYDDTSFSDDDSSDVDDSSDFTVTTSDFLDCLDPCRAEYMVGAATVKEIDERFGHCLPCDWLEVLSFDIRQQYSEPDQGKGQHDGEGGTVKKHCYNGELSGARSPNATGVCKTMTQRCGQKEGVKEVLPIEEYIQRSDSRLLKVTPGTISKRVYQVFLEDPALVMRLRDEGYEHAHYIKRKNPTQEYTKTVKGSEQFKEILFPKKQAGAEEGLFVMWSSTLGCPCRQCEMRFNHKDCKYQHLRKVERHILQTKTARTNMSELREEQTVRRVDPPQVKEALRRLCLKHKRSNLTKDDLVDLIVNHFSLPEPTREEKSLKQYLVKILFAASFPGETLDLELSQSAPKNALFEELPEESVAINDDGFYFNDDEPEPDLYAGTMAREGTSGSQQLLGLGHISLENFGNTCYLNALLQLLSSSQQVLSMVGRLWLDDVSGNREALANSVLLSELATTVVMLNNLHGPHCLSLRNLLRLFLHCYSMSGNDPMNYQLTVQHDPSEFLRSLLECICQESEGTSSGFQKLFRVTLDEAFLNGQVLEINDTCLHISIPASTTLEVNLEEALKSCLANLNARVTKWPNILIVAVDCLTDATGIVSDTKVRFEESLTFLGSPNYKLRGTVNRSGVHASAGHYTAHVKRASVGHNHDDNERSSPWIMCNDVELLVVGADEVFGVQSQRSIRMLLFEVELQQEMRDVFLDANGNTMQMVDFYKEKVVFSNEELWSMDLGRLSHDQLELQLASRNIPVIHLPSTPTEPLANQLRSYLQDNN